MEWQSSSQYSTIKAGLENQQFAGILPILWAGLGEAFY
jgi:hypothetical protein